MFNNRDSSHDIVARAGERFFLTLYGAHSADESLNKYRFNCFTKSVTKIKPDIASLPPTEGAAKQHSFRVYHQVQKWQGNELPPELWGWKRVQTNLAPITTLEPVAPENLLNLVFCKCKTGCGAMCGCRKAGINCTTVCNNCHGNCLNSTSTVVDEVNEDEIENADEQRSETCSRASSRAEDFEVLHDQSNFSMANEDIPSSSLTSRASKRQRQ